MFDPWEVIETIDCVHVIPINDNMGHNTNDPSCFCNPNLEFVSETGRWIVTHNSFDGREITDDRIKSILQ